MEMKTRYHHLGDRTCICILTLPSGWEVTGTAATIDPKNYDRVEGEKWALEDATRKLNNMETFYKHEYEFRKERTKEKQV